MYFKKNRHSLFLFLLILGFSLNLSAQDDLDVDVDEDGRVLLAPSVVDISESYIGFSIGVSLPSENFSNTLPYEESGFAKAGLKASLDGSFIFFRNLGLGYTFGFSKNKVDEQAYLQKVNYHLPDGSLVGSFDNKSWLSTTLAIGPYMSLPEKNFMFDFGFLFGLTYAVTPEIVYTGMFNNQNMETRFRRDGAITPAMNIFVGVNRHFSKDFRAYLKAEMFFARPLFKEITEIEGETFQINSVDELKQSVGYIGISLGIAYELGSDKQLANKRKTYRKKFRRMNWLIKKGKDK